MNRLAAILGLFVPGLALAVTITYTKVTVDTAGQLYLETTGGTVVAAPVDPVPLQTNGKQRGFGQPQIAPDQLTVGWLAEYENCCTSYPIPLQLVLFRNGMIIQKLRGNGLPIWSWKFETGSQHIVFVQRPTHGAAPDHYELRDVESGQLLEEYDHDDDEALDKMPSWAQELNWNR